MNKRGQVAVEFLITYGWAFAVILGTLATLSYIGIFNTDVFVKEQCSFFSGVYCIDSQANTSTVSIVVQNGMPITMNGLSIVIPDCNTSAASGPTTLTSGEQGIFRASCPLFTQTIFKSDIYLNYTNPDSGFNHTKLGSVTYRVS